MGIKKVIPAICERSVKTASHVKTDRWQRIADESLKQCGRSRPLIIAPPLPFQDVLKQTPDGDKILMHPYSQQPAGQFTSGRSNGLITAAIGPEGGFTEREVSFALNSGFIPLQFGKLIYKIETAIIVAAACCVTRAGGLD
jgi:16S rRNA (uracil1498-N3)-methyltransferase